MTDCLTYLSGADIAALDMPVGEAREAIEALLREGAGGGNVTGAKGRLQVDDSRFMVAMSSASEVAGQAGLKWVGYSDGNRALGLPTISALVVLNDLATGRPVAVMDGTWITTVRTAALSAIAARHIAAPGAAELGFLGCGVQAHSHLEALSLVLPELRKVRAVSRSRGSAEALVARARDMGLDAEVAADPEALVRGVDVVVSALPAGAGVTPVADARWLRPGAVVLGVDLGRSWLAEGVAGAVDLFVTDSRAQAEAPGGSDQFPFKGPFDTDLAGLVTGAHPGRRGPRERAMFLFSGLALGDLAVAGKLLSRAHAAGTGTRLPL